MPSICSFGLLKVEIGGRNNQVLWKEAFEMACTSVV